jgi:hypothetical protein
MPGEGLLSADPFQLTGLKPASRAMSPSRAVDSPAASRMGGSKPLFCSSVRCSGANLSQKGSGLGEAGRREDLLNYPRRNCDIYYFQIRGFRYCLQWNYRMP